MSPLNEHETVSPHDEAEPDDESSEIRANIFGTIGMYSPILVSSFTMATV